MMCTTSTIEYRSRLEQTTTFKPLMRKSISLTTIARGTRQHHVIDIMSRVMLSTTYGNSMFNLEDIFPVALLELGMTTRRVVATVVLQSQLVLYLLRSKYPSYCFFICSTIVSVCTLCQNTAFRFPVVFVVDTYPLSICLVISSILFMSMFEMSFAIERLACTYLLSVLFITLLSLLTHQLSMSFTIVSLPFENLFSLKLILVFLLLFYLFQMSLTVLLVILSFLFLVFLVKPLMVFNMSIIIGFHRDFLALLALWTKPTFLVFCSSEKRRCSRKELLTLTALLQRGILRYDVIHNEAYSLLSASGCFEHRRGTTLLPPQYNIKPLLKQVEGSVV